MNKMSTLELASKYPEAFAALPIPYQNDDCLEFYLDEDGFTCCKPAPGQEQILGNWECCFDPVVNMWVGQGTDYLPDASH